MRFKVICFTYWREKNLQDLGLDRKSLDEKKQLEEEIDSDPRESPAC